MSKKKRSLIKTAHSKDVDDSKIEELEIDKEYAPDYETLATPTFAKVRTDKLKLHLTDVQVMNIRAMYDICNKKNCEMLALGTTKIDAETGTVSLIELFVPEQEAGGASCDAKPEAMAKIIMAGKTVNFWVHTHPGMGAFWSSTDDSTARELCGTETPFIVSLVIGNSHKMQARIDISNPINLMLAIPIVIDGGVDKVTAKKWEKIFKEKISKTVYSYTDPIGSPHFNDRDGFWESYYGRGAGIDNKWPYRKNGKKKEDEGAPHEFPAAKRHYRY